MPSSSEASAGLPRCRTCARGEGRVVLRHAKLLFVCGRCADRTPLRCAVCDASLGGGTKRGPCFSATCDECRVRVLVDASGRETEREDIRAPVKPDAPVATRPAAAKDPSRVPAGYIQIRRGHASDGGYREGVAAQQVELTCDPPGVRRDLTPRDPGPIGAAALLSGVVALPVLLALIFSGAELAFVAKLVGVIFALAVGVVLAVFAIAALTRSPEPPALPGRRRILIDADGLEASPLDESWSGKLSPDEVKAIRVEPSTTKGRFRVRVELDDARTHTLMDGLTREQHAEWVVHEIERALRRTSDPE